MDAFIFFVYTFLSAIQQGIITWLFREFVPEKYQEWIDAALHKGGILIYGVLISYVLWAEHWKHWLFTILIASAVRVFVFDPVLNATKWWFSKREKRQETFVLFAIGDSSFTDSSILKFSQYLSIPAATLRLIIWVMSVVAFLLLYFFVPIK